MVWGGGNRIKISSSCDAKDRVRINESVRFLAIKIKLKEGQVARAVRLRKSAGHPVNFAFQINNKFFSIFKCPRYWI